MEYFITDQQGNTRVSFEDNNGTVALIQENSYYAFGMQMAGGYTPTTNPNKKLYNAGSEWQDDIEGLADYYSTFFREYDPVIGRFNGVDLLAEITDEISTYAYADNNPVMMNDPLGASANRPPKGWHPGDYGLLPNTDDLNDLFESISNNDLQTAYLLWHEAQYGGRRRGGSLNFGNSGGESVDESNGGGRRDGRNGGWIRNIATSKYEWNPNVGKNNDNIPKGYMYVGANGAAIIKDLGLNQSYPIFKDSWAGAVIGENEKNMQAEGSTVYNVRAYVTASVFITAIISYTGNDVMHGTPIFTGVSIHVGISAGNSGPNNLVSLNFTGNVRVNYNSKAYSAGLAEPTQDYLKENNRKITEANIFVPAQDLRRNVNSTPVVNISGQFMNGRETMGYPTMVGFWVPKHINFLILPNLNLYHIK